MSLATLPAIDDVLATMRAHLVSEETRVRAASAHGNGFEGWLKFEFAHAMHTKYRSLPWADAKVGNLAHGVEYRYEHPGERGTRRDPSERYSKIVDLWLAAKNVDKWTAPNATYYFELKTVFHHANRGKQLAGWRRDFETLEGLLMHDSSAVGYASVLVAIGFNDDAWDASVGEGEDGGARWKRDDVTPVVGNVRFAALRAWRESGAAQPR